MIYYIVAVLNGFFNSINKMMNVKAGQVFGTANGSLINYFEATVLSLALVYMTGNGQELSASYMMTVPIWAYLGGVSGLVAMVLIIIGTLRTNVLISSILTLVGKLGAALVLDFVLYGVFSWWKVLGIFMILVGVGWIEKTKLPAKQEEV